MPHKARPRRPAEGHGHGRGLVVVEEQRRQIGPRPEPVAAFGAGGGFYGVPEGSEPLDIPPEGSRRDSQLVSEIPSVPTRLALQQAEQTEEPGRGI